MNDEKHTCGNCIACRNKAINEAAESYAKMINFWIRVAELMPYFGFLLLGLILGSMTGNINTRCY